MNREGDIYAAMLDCYKALSLDKDHLKSHFRLSKCLNDLKWHEEALECINSFCKRFPDYANTQACENLIKDINKSVKTLKEQESKKLIASKSRKESISSSSSSKSKKTKISDSNSASNQSANQNIDDFLVTTNENIEANDDNDYDDEEDEDEQEVDVNSLNDENERFDELSQDGNRFDDNNNKMETEAAHSSKATCTNIRFLEKLLKRNILQKDKNRTMYDRAKMNAIDLKMRYCGHCNVDTG
jgi:hypothetical protein